MQSLRMLMKARPAALSSHVDIIMGRLLDCATDPVYEVKTRLFPLWFQCYQCQMEG